MGLRETLLELSRHHMAEIPARDRIDFEDELDRLRMMRLAEDGLGVGDYLPDFELQDGVGHVMTSGQFLDKGPLVVAFFRGDWCPYCDLTMTALHKAMPAIEALGASAIGIVPERREHVVDIVERRKLAFPLLSDPANAYARMCGLAYELSPQHIRIHSDRKRDFPKLHADTTWRLPIPAVFVVEPSARVAFAFSDVNPARWPDPEELLAALEALANAPALSKR
jgi:peroxiredoxin